MASSTSITSITSIDDFSAWLLTSPAALHVVWAYAEWHEPCKTGGAIDIMFQKLSEAFAAASFAKVRNIWLPNVIPYRWHSSWLALFTRSAHSNQILAATWLLFCVSLQVNAEEVVELAESLDISVVPTFFLYKVRYCTGTSDLLRRQWHDMIYDIAE
jgi:hypothetical protein